MRSYLFAVTAAIVLLTAIGIVSPSLAQDYPWCLQGRTWGYPGNCQFSTYWQCEATASGTFSYCGINPVLRMRVSIAVIIIDAATENGKSDGAN